MDKVSVIIPVREEPVLKKTIDEVLNNADGNIEVIVALDGYWPDPALKPDPRITIIHKGEPIGMRANENAAAAIATGKYLMKLDGHCKIGKSYDTILKAGHSKNCISVPSRYSLNLEKWKHFRGPVDYLYLTFPYTDDNIYGPGFHGKKFKGPTGEDGSFWHLERERKKIKLDEIMIFQGSCWFMERQHYFNIGGLDPDLFYQEAAELSFKTWMSGGRVVRNKNTWYAHYHKRKTDNFPRYGLSKRKKVETVVYMMDYWPNDRWPQAKIKFADYIEKFLPLFGWPDDWQDEKYSRGWVHPWLKKKGFTYDAKNKKRG